MCDVLNIKSKSAISIIGNYPENDKKENNKKLDSFLDNLMKYARVSNTDCIITDVRKNNKKVSFADLIERKVLENPYYLNNYKNKIKIIGITPLSSLNSVRLNNN